MNNCTLHPQSERSSTKNYCKDCHAAYQREYMRKNEKARKRHSLSKKKWYKRKKNDFPEYFKEYYEKNKERCNGYSRKWQEKNREKYLEYQRKYRAKRRKELKKGKKS